MPGRPVVDGSGNFEVIRLEPAGKLPRKPSIGPVFLTYGAGGRNRTDETMAPGVDFQFTYEKDILEHR